MKKNDLTTKDSLSEIKLVVQKAKEVKERKEWLRLLVEVAALYSQIREAEKRMNKFVKDKNLSKDIINDAKELTEEDIEAIREFIKDEEPKYFTLKDSGFWTLTTATAFQPVFWTII